MMNTGSAWTHHVSPITQPFLGSRAAIQFSFRRVLSYRQPEVDSRKGEIPVPLRSGKFTSGQETRRESGRSIVC